VAAECQDGLVLDQQQLIADEARGASGHEPMLQIPGVAIRRPTEPQRGD
jgi:hypothetical protein